MLFANETNSIALTACLSRSNLSGWSAFFFYGVTALGFLAIGLSLTGCAAPFLALGSSATAAASSVGTAAATVAVANPSTAASAITTVTTGKSPLEHAASAATRQDCNFLNALGPKPICTDILVPQVKDRSELYLGPADIAAPKAQP